MPAQGLAVVIDMLLTTAFMSLLILTVWRKHWALSLAFLLVFGAIEATFLSSSVLKVHPASSFRITVYILPSTGAELLDGHQILSRQAQVRKQTSISMFIHYVAATL